MSDSTASVLTGGQGDAPAPAPAPAAPVAAPAAAPTPAPAPAAPVSWLGEADELTQGYVSNKGWQSGADAVKSYQNLEKLLGADRAGNTVILPKPDATPEELGAFYNRLGRPADASGYKIEMPAAGGDPEFAKTAGSWFHELGLSQKQGEALAAKWNEYAGGLMSKSTEVKQQSFAADDLALKSEWGAAFNQNLAHAQNAVRGLGLDNATIDKLSDSMGHKATMNLLAKIGAKAGESEFVAGDKPSGFSNALTPAEAKAKIAERIQDKNFHARYVKGDVEAKNEMAMLHKYAYPEG